MQRKKSLWFIVLIGIVSLFSDMVYEGARSIAGPFLESLQANAFVVGFFAGLGELIGYGLRLLTGYLADRTRRYWFFIFLGYAFNLLSVPLLALAGYWQLAVVLMMAERFGKAIRTPSRDAMLAHATSSTGRGWGYGLHEALDQVGATIGPLFVMLALSATHKNYHFTYAWMIIPAVIALSVLLFARIQYPSPEKLSVKKLQVNPKGLRRFFWHYMMVIAFIAMGFVDFPLIAFHLKHTHVLDELWIPGLYAVAMISDALSALVFGRLYDRFGIRILALALALGLFFSPLAFFGSAPWVIVAVILWGIVLGAHESILKASVADVAPAGRIASAFGIFHTLFGVSWFLGSALMGYLYSDHLTAMVIFPVICQGVAIALLLRMKRMPA